ncbi:beta-glucosidase [Streptomyces sp. NPDC003011]
MTVVDAAASQRIRQARGRAEKRVAELTLDEKLQLVHGTGRPSRITPNGTAGKVSGVPRLGIPDLVMADGPNGVGNGSQGVTAFAAAVSMAASWDPDLLSRLGRAMGNEHAAKGHGVALTPTVNILRLPHWGRSFETFGEDPYLSAQLAVAQIAGIHDSGVLATVKHLAANNQENNRWQVDTVVGERALREIYLPAFEAAVASGVLVVMTAYNKVNGHFAGENHHLVTEILKNDWGFAGFTVSDWAATHDATASALAGLDVEMPHGPLPQYPKHYGDELAAAVKSGAVPLARLDDMVIRVLTAMEAVGLIHPQRQGHVDAPAATTEHRDLARRAVAAGTVLLRNEHQALPLTTELSSIAVIGAAADTAPVVTGGGSALVRAQDVVTPLRGIEARAGAGIDVRYSPGTAGTGMLPPLPAPILRSQAGSHGWDAQYFPTADHSGAATTVQVEPAIDTQLAAGRALAGVWSARWTTTFTPETTGPHRFTLDASGYATLRLGDSAEHINDGRDLSTVEHLTVHLTADVPLSIELDYRAELLEKRIPRVGVGMLPPDPELLQHAVATAAASDVAVVVVNDLRTEGSDVPSLALPGDQDDLIRAVATANPRTVVVLHTAGPVLMPWLDQVAAVVEAWYPGQENGTGLADVLFGDVNPSGRLPMTFPRADDQHPAGADPRRYPGSDGVVRYDEELLVGYRWWHATQRTPLFPFGHGLSYTTFAYDDLEIAVDGDDVTVAWTVTNIGECTGRDVPQVYLGYPEEVGEPPWQLRRFHSVLLEPGQSKRLTTTLSTADRRFWNDAANRWSVSPGRHRIAVGASATDLRLLAAVTLPSVSLPPAPTGDQT